MPVAPYTGARIETVHVTFERLYTYVAPDTGARIET